MGMSPSAKKTVLHVPSPKKDCLSDVLLIIVIVFHIYSSIITSNGRTVHHRTTCTLSVINGYKCSFLNMNETDQEVSARAGLHRHPVVYNVSPHYPSC